MVLGAAKGVNVDPLKGLSIHADIGGIQARRIMQGSSQRSGGEGEAAADSALRQTTGRGVWSCQNEYVQWRGVDLVGSLTIGDNETEGPQMESAKLPFDLGRRFSAVSDIAHMNMRRFQRASGRKHHRVPLESACFAYATASVMGPC